MSNYVLHLYGSFELKSPDNKTISLRTDKHRALLAYLVLAHSGNAVRRSYLAQMFWSEFRVDSARQSLRNALYELRKAFSPLQIVQADSKNIVFHADHPDFWCDALVSPRQPAESENQPLLMGFSLDDCPQFMAWLENERRARKASTAAQEEAFQPGQPIPDYGQLVGRQEELAQLRRWLLDEKARLVGIYGVGGQGKTALAASLARSLPVGSYDRVLWCSLLNGQSWQTSFREWANALAVTPLRDWPEHVDGQISLLIRLASQHSCLLVLDNLETILEAGETSGRFRPGYEAYGQFLERMARTEHGSAVLLTSREKPVAVLRLGLNQPAVHGMDLTGLSSDAAAAMLKVQRLRAEPQTIMALHERLSGNPLALLLAAATVDDLFLGDVARFLQGESLIVGDIRAVLDEQFRRLSPLEREVLDWLALEREAVSLEDLQNNLARHREMSPLLEAMAGLRRRLLVEVQTAAAYGGEELRYALQNVVLEYATEQLIERALDELQRGDLALLRSHTLLKAQTTEYVHASQRQLILLPLVERLRNIWGVRQQPRNLRRLLAQLRGESRTAIGYAATNLLHLLLACAAEESSAIAGADFSGLPVRHAWLRDETLPDVNFQEADLTGSLFTEYLTGVRDVAVDPGGRLVAAGCEDGKIWLWQRKTQALHRMIETNAGAAWSIDFSPDSRLLACATTNGTVQLWDVTGGWLYKTLSQAGQAVWSVAFTPDGRSVAGSRGNAVEFWDTTTGRCTRSVTGRGEILQRLALSPDGLWLAASDDAQVIYLWEQQTGRLVRQWSAERGGVQHLAFSPDSSLLVAAIGHGLAQGWSVEDGATVLDFRTGGGPINYLAFSPDGSTLAGADIDNLIRLWDVPTGRQRLLRGHTYIVWCLAFSPDGRHLISGGADQLVCLWDVKNARLLHALHSHRRAVANLAATRDGELLVTASDDLVVRLWDTTTWRVVRQWPAHESSIVSIAISADDLLVATAGSDSALFLWDMASGQLVRSFVGNTRPLHRILLHPDRPLIFSAGHDGQIRMWDVPTGRLLSTTEAHKDGVRSLAFRPDGPLLVSSGNDERARVWALEEDGSLRMVWAYATSDSERGFGINVAVHPCLPLIACSANAYLHIIDFESRRVLHKLDCRAVWVSDIAFSPDGEWLVNVDVHERRLRWWRSATWELAAVGALTSRVDSVAFSPDGAHLYTAGDGFFEVWDVASQTPIRKVPLPGPYEGMNIRDATGISQAQRWSLLALGAVEK